MMKRVGLFVLVVMLAFGTLPTMTPVAAATDLETLTESAQYFPAETIIWLSVRTDGAFFDELDTLVTTVREGLPPGTIPELSMRDAANEALRSMGAALDFERDVRPWLGDTMSGGVLSLETAFDHDFSNDDDIPYLVVMDVTDRDLALELAETLFADGIEAGEVTRSSEDGVDLFIGVEGTNIPAYALTEDALMVAFSEDQLPLGGVDEPLSESERFTETLAMLPDTAYNMVGYNNAGPATAEAMESQMGMAALLFGSMTSSITSLYRSAPAQVFGLTVLDDVNLVIDMAQSPYDLDALAEFGVEMDYAVFQPVDADFAERIPAGTTALILGTGFGESVNAGLDAMGAGLELAIQGAFTFMRFDDGASELDNLPTFVTTIGRQDFRNMVTFYFAGLTGMNLEDQLLVNMNGSSATFLRAYESDVLGLTLDAALLFDLPEDDIADDIYENLSDALDAYDANFEREDDDIITFDEPFVDLFPPDFPDELATADDFDLLLGIDDTMLAFGTRPGVEFGLGLDDGATLADDADYRAASRYLLADAETIYFFNVKSLLPLLETLGALVEPYDPTSARDLRQAVGVIGLVDSASGSAVINDDSSQVVRLVLTLSADRVSQATALAE